LASGSAISSEPQCISAEQRRQAESRPIRDVIVRYLPKKLPVSRAFFSPLAQLCQNRLSFFRRFPYLIEKMARPVDWTPLLPEALERLRALTSQTVYRGALERIFQDSAARRHPAAARVRRRTGGSHLSARPPEADRRAGTARGAGRAFAQPGAPPTAGGGSFQVPGRARSRAAPGDGSAGRDPDPPAAGAGRSRRSGARAVAGLFFLCQ
jgi:hypothetical protein